MILSAIAAMAQNRIIGDKNRLPWHLPEDLKFFKEKTKGKILIMGRKTFESLPGALPNRFHILISRDVGYVPPANIKIDPSQYAVCNSLDTAITLAEEMLKAQHPAYRESFGDEVFIAGGGEIYKQSLDRIDRLYLTVIEKDFAGDAYFPELSNDLQLAEKIERQEPIPFSFRTYTRK